MPPALSYLLDERFNVFTTVIAMNSDKVSIDNQSLKTVPVGQGLRRAAAKFSGFADHQFPKSLHTFVPNISDFFDPNLARYEKARLSSDC